MFDQRWICWKKMKKSSYNTKVELFFEILQHTILGDYEQNFFKRSIVDLTLLIMIIDIKQIITSFPVLMMVHASAWITLLSIFSLYCRILLHYLLPDNIYVLIFKFWIYLYILSISMNSSEYFEYNVQIKSESKVLQYFDSIKQNFVIPEWRSWRSTLNYEMLNSPDTLQVSLIGFWYKAERTAIKSTVLGLPRFAWSMTLL